MSAPNETGSAGRHAARPNDPVTASDSAAADENLEVRPAAGQTVEVRPAAEPEVSRPTATRDDEHQADEAAGHDVEDTDGHAERAEGERKSAARPLLGPGSTGPRTAPSTDAVTDVDAPALDTMPRPATP